MIDTLMVRIRSRYVQYENLVDLLLENNHNAELAP